MMAQIDDQSSAATIMIAFRDGRIGCPGVRLSLLLVYEFVIGGHFQIRFDPSLSPVVSTKTMISIIKRRLRHPHS
jgi:hypothetical protein